MSRLCARPIGKKTAEFDGDIFKLSGRKTVRLVESVESVDHDVGLDYLLPVKRKTIVGTRLSEFR